MRRTHTISKIAALAIAAGSLLVMASSTRSISAQTDEWTPPYPMLLTPERALAFVRASDRKLDYLPGEVIVKFRQGIGTSGVLRALTSVRSRPALNALRWMGDDIAVLKDAGEADATILAAQLKTQPEVAFAEPNYLYHTSATPPNDPGFAGRQWNLTALDMPRVWEMNPGGKDTVIVAVIDTGITTVSRSYQFPTWKGSDNRTISIH